MVCGCPSSDRRMRECVLFGQAALTRGLSSLFSCARRFSYLTVDRFGIQFRTFFGEKSFSWKELGPIRPRWISVRPAACSASLDRLRHVQR